jgi:citrate lyase subunit beta / citryl-CoA lyase
MRKGKRIMKRGRVVSAGRMDEWTRSDCIVELEVRTKGGIQLTLDSKVSSMYGRTIRREVMEACSTLGLKDAAIRIVDQGALPFVLAARLEAAVRRAMPDLAAEVLPEPRVRSHQLSPKERHRRTRLYLPGNEPKFLPNAALHRPDAVVLDLEDSVAPNEKDAARLLVRNALRCVDFGDSEVMVRINQGRIGLDDLRAIVPQGPDCIVIPKSEDPESVKMFESEIRAIERGMKLRRSVLLLPIIESALGVVNAFAIASASSRVCGLAIGLEDYTADIGVERTPEGRESLYARATVVNAAKAAGVQALDSVYSDVDDLEGLRLSTLEAKSLGFEGKGCIHPRQIPIVHDAFAPTAQEIERAERIVAASKEAERSGSGVVALVSKMIDPPVVRRAERLLRLTKVLEKEGAR